MHYCVGHAIFLPPPAGNTETRSRGHVARCTVRLDGRLSPWQRRGLGERENGQPLGRLASLEFTVHRSLVGFSARWNADTGDPPYLRGYYRRRRRRRRISDALFSCLLRSRRGTSRPRIPPLTAFMDPRCERKLKKRSGERTPPLSLSLSLPRGRRATRRRGV